MNLIQSGSCNICSVDDIVVLGECEEKLQKLIDEFGRVYKRMKLKDVPGR